MLCPEKIFYSKESFYWVYYKYGIGRTEYDDWMSPVFRFNSELYWIHAFFNDTISNKAWHQ